MLRSNKSLGIIRRALEESALALAGAETQVCVIHGIACLCSRVVHEAQEGVPGRLWMHAAI